MPDITFTEAQQRALRSLVSAEPVPGSPLPHTRFLEQVTTLIPCEDVAVTLADVPAPLPIGLRWASREPGRVRTTLGHGVVDRLLLGFRNGSDLVVQLALDRRSKPFSHRDVAVLLLLEPVLGRLFRERPAPHLPRHLTVQERHVLRLVATGASNAEIAERMGIAPCTVRKHLEHAHPKLGVTNRLAAALAFQGGALPGPDRAARVEIFA
ncbi:MAG: helix-turn-helix transcriptional regulator [Nocardioides sp.]